MLYPSPQTRLYLFFNSHVRSPVSASAFPNPPPLPFLSPFLSAFFPNMPSVALKLLFLVTQHPKEIRAEWPYYQSWTLHRSIHDLKCDVQVLCWLDSSLTTQVLAIFDVFSFLWCNNYDEHGSEFLNFLGTHLYPAQKIYPKLRVVNNNEVILNTTDKSYLLELQRAGFAVPETTYVSTFMLSTFPTPSKFRDLSLKLFHI
jgi:hypothetical protein